MVLVLPEPAECWIRYLPPAPSARTAATSLRVASSWWKRGKMTFAIRFLAVALGDQVPPEDLQPTLALPDPLPQVGGAVARRD